MPESYKTKYGKIKMSDETYGVHIYPRHEVRKKEIRYSVEKPIAYYDTGDGEHVIFYGEDKTKRKNFIAVVISVILKIIKTAYRCNKIKGGNDET